MGVPSQPIVQNPTMFSGTANDPSTIPGTVEYDQKNGTNTSGNYPQNGPSTNNGNGNPWAQNGGGTNDVGQKIAPGAPVTGTQAAPLNNATLGADLSQNTTPSNTIYSDPRVMYAASNAVTGFGTNQNDPFLNVNFQNAATGNQENQDLVSQMSNTANNSENRSISGTLGQQFMLLSIV